MPNETPNKWSAIGALLLADSFSVHDVPSAAEAQFTSKESLVIWLGNKGWPQAFAEERIAMIEAAFAPTEAYLEEPLPIGSTIIQSAGVVNIYNNAIGIDPPDPGIVATGTGIEPPDPGLYAQRLNVNSLSSVISAGIGGGSSVGQSDATGIEPPDPGKKSN